MRAPWRRRDTLKRLEGDLSDQRPEPSDEFVARIKRDTGQPSRSRAPRPKFGLALAVAAGFVATVIALGGVNAPLNGAKSIFGAETAKSNAPAANQYSQQVTLCHRPPGNPANAKTLRVGQPAVTAHLRNHPDNLGPCP